LSAEENKAAARRMVEELFNQGGNLDAALLLFRVLVCLWRIVRRHCVSCGSAGLVRQPERVVNPAGFLASLGAPADFVPYTRLGYDAFVTLG
jgi:hypothetical protein